MTKSAQKLPERRVVILIFDGVQMLDVAGPAQAFSTANDEGAAPAYEIVFAAVGSGAARSAQGLTLLGAPLARAARLDTLVVPGGPGVHPLRADPASLGRILRACRRSRRVASVCTGAFVLAQLGVLDGRRAVTHWRSCRRLAEEFPAVRVEEDPIFVRDGDVWTTAGVTAGIDMTLSLIEEDHGTPLAARVARRLVVYMRRAGGQRQFSEALALQVDAAAPFAGLVEAISASPRSRWTVEAMARHVGLTERTFHRKFVAATGTTPAEAVERIRCDLARSLLASTGLSMAAVAARAGFGSGSAFRRALHRQFGVGPAQLG